MFFHSQTYFFSIVHIIIYCVFVINIFIINTKVILHFCHITEGLRILISDFHLFSILINIHTQLPTRIVLMFHYLYTIYCSSKTYPFMFSFI